MVVSCDYFYLNSDTQTTIMSRFNNKNKNYSVDNAHSHTYTQTHTHIVINRPADNKSL